MFGDGLRSAVLYGSAAAGEHIPSRSDYNVLVIADRLDVSIFARCRRPFARGPTRAILRR